MLRKKSINVLDKVNKVERVAKSMFYIWGIFIIIYVFFRVRNGLIVGNLDKEIIQNLNYIVSIALKEMIRTIYITFPFFLFLFSIVTFITSYTIFSGKIAKNVIIFLFIIFSSYVADNLFGPFNTTSMSTLSPTKSFLFMIITAFLTFIIIYLIQKRIHLEGKETLDTDDEKNIDDLLNEHINAYKPKIDGKNHISNLKNRRKRLGIIISAIIALIISMIFLLHIEKYDFVTSGLILGILLSGLSIQSEKIALGLLYFMDPEEAETIFKTYILARARDQKQKEILIKKEVIDLTSEYTKEKELGQLMAMKIALMKKLEYRRSQKISMVVKEIDEGDLSIDEIIFKIREINRELPKLIETDAVLEPQNLPLLDDGSKSYSIGEKIGNLIGLEVSEVKDAIKEQLIAKNQSHIWLQSNMQQIKYSLYEFDRGEFTEYNQQICIPNSLKIFLHHNEYIIRSLAENILKLNLSDKPIKLELLKGSKDLQIYYFSTHTKSYSAILKKSQEGILSILGIFEE